MLLWHVTYFAPSLADLQFSLYFFLCFPAIYVPVACLCSSDDCVQHAPGRQTHRERWLVLQHTALLKIMGVFHAPWAEIELESTGNTFKLEL